MEERMLFNVIEIIAVALSCVAASIHCVHIFQMERYQLPVYNQWLKRSRERFVQKNVVVGVIAAVARWYLPMLFSLFSSVEAARNAAAGWVTLMGFVIAVAALTVREVRMPMKRPLVLTMRAKRLFGALTLLYAALVLFLCILGAPAVYLAYVTAPYAVWLAGRIMHPVEEKINTGFYEEARAKLRDRKDLIKIGITGSYGKTLTKFILKELLSAKYEVLATPASFNTAMGISRVVNDQLEDKHQVFIAEMGAQHVGDIKHLVKLVKPKYGMITSIGDQHMDTFGSMANIAETKYELIAGLPEDGMAFFAADSGYADRLYGMCKLEKYSAAVNLDGEHFMCASELTISGAGTEFVLECADGGRVRCKTRLLGRCNVQNIALASALARKLGLTMEEIADGIGRLQPFERRLQLISGGDRIIIDDTLNDRPLGAAEALNVLSECPGRRIIVTSGLPQEAKSEDVNYAFGVQMKGCVDGVILVGEKKKLQPIWRGLVSTGFPKSSIRVAADLNDAEELLATITSEGDTVLYEGEFQE